MFTPQKKAWSGWSSLTPRKSVLGSGQNPNSVDAGKGKTVAFVETTPNLENGGNILVDAAGDPELLAEKVSKLEIEVCGGSNFFFLGCFCACACAIFGGFLLLLTFLLNWVFKKNFCLIGCLWNLDCCYYDLSLFKLYFGTKRQFLYQGLVELKLFLTVIL